MGYVLWSVDSSKSIDKHAIGLAYAFGNRRMGRHTGFIILNSEEVFEMGVAGLVADLKKQGVKINVSATAERILPKQFTMDCLMYNPDDDADITGKPGSSRGAHHQMAVTPGMTSPPPAKQISSKALGKTIPSNGKAAVDLLPAVYSSTVRPAEAADLDPPSSGKPEGAKRKRDENASEVRHRLDTLSP